MACGSLKGYQNMLWFGTRPCHRYYFCHDSNFSFKGLKLLAHDGQCSTTIQHLKFSASCSIAHSASSTKYNWNPSSWSFCPCQCSVGASANFTTPILHHLLEFSNDLYFSCGVHVAVVDFRVHVSNSVLLDVLLRACGGTFLILSCFIATIKSKPPYPPTDRMTLPDPEALLRRYLSKIPIPQPLPRLPQHKQRQIHKVLFESSKEVQGRQK
jgi:hypothetical protein